MNISYKVFLATGAFSFLTITGVQARDEPVKLEETRKITGDLIYGGQAIVPGMQGHSAEARADSYSVNMRTHAQEGL